MSVINAINLNGTTYSIGGAGMTEETKQSLLTLVEKVAYVDANGQDYYDALYAALYPPADLSYITAVYTQSGTVYDTDSLNVLKPDLVVTAHNTDSTTQTVTAYTLSGTLEVGTSTITVSYGGKTTTFNVTVTEGEHDTTAVIETSGYVESWVSSAVTPQARTYGGITKAYDIPATTSLYPAGIIPYADNTFGNAVGIIVAYDSNGDHVNHVSMRQSSDNRWAQKTSPYTEFSQEWTIDEYTKITFNVDTRYLDDAYMYDKTTGLVFFAGRNTPYYGMSNIS